MEAPAKPLLDTLVVAGNVAATWPDRVAELEAKRTAPTRTRALLAGSPAWAPRGPFDRVLAAQALVGNLTVATKDAAFADVIGMRRLTWS